MPEHLQKYYAFYGVKFQLTGVRRKWPNAAGTHLIRVIAFQKFEERSPFLKFPLVLLSRKTM